MLDPSACALAYRNETIRRRGLNAAKIFCVPLLLDLTRRETRNFGLVFASNLVKELKTTTPMFKVPHQQASFKVLEAPDVPSAMIELGFLSNPEDEKLLASDDWRRKTAESVVHAIDDFFERRVAQGTPQ